MISSNNNSSSSLANWADHTAASSTVPSERKPSKTVEERYQKKTPIEHVLHRPESYIGSVQLDSQHSWVWSEAEERMAYKEITYVPGLYKIFDEILVNAADVKARESQDRSRQKMTTLKVDIDRENKSISIYNDGDGIPIEIHKVHNIYVPELIFGHLLTSDNYDDTEQRVTGGRNGYGAKLTNIFSKSFTVECSDSTRKRKFKKTWRRNMSASDDSKITDYKDGKDYVKITFTPDLARFHMDSLDDDIVSLLTRRVYDMAGCCGVKVWLNGRKLPISDFKSYVDLFLPSKSDAKQPIKVYEKSGRWEVVISMSEGQFQQVSFVNSICTSKGGTHVNYVTDPLIQAILKKVNTKNKGGMEIKAHHVKQHLWVFVNCLIVNPTFDSQTKEALTLKMTQFGSKFTVSEKTIAAVIKSEILESVLLWAKAKQQVELQRKMKGTGGRAGKDHLRGIPKLEDANDAGTKHSESCTLILTEGESAKTSCVAGLSVVGKDRYGVFPLRGKLLNVREATFKQQVDNQEIQAILKIMGLQVGKKIDNPKGLRYGSLMIMTDQDLDGSHIKGLLLNMISHYWPGMLQFRGFLKEFVTPIVKCFKGRQTLAFFTLSEYEKWKRQNDNGKGWKIKYYKGLGTSTDTEFKEYFSDLNQHCLDFEYTGPEDYDAIDMAFNGKRAEDRKVWIQNYRDDNFVDHSQATVTYKDFIHKELVAFSRYDTIRSIPCCMDGLKPVQRKVLFAAFKRNLKNEIKVAQFMGYVSEKTAYHHGEQSLGQTIIGMAQTFVGSNNLNLLEPRGQFGSRKEGGKDASAVRYIFTRLSPLARALFPEADDPLLEYQNDDGLMVEPKFYVPVIPLVLANGAEGIGTGWSSSVPNYNPRDLIANIRRFIRQEALEPMVPWFRGFVGKIEAKGAQGFESVGLVRKLDAETIEISELPARMWTQNFKNNLEKLLEGAAVPAGPARNRKRGDNGDNGDNDSSPEERKRGSKENFKILDYRDNSSHEDIRFTVKLSAENMAKVEKEGLESAFKLHKAIGTTNMTLFDHELKVMRYGSPLDIIREFAAYRLQLYEVRKAYLTEKLERERRILRNKVNFIEAIVKGTLDIKNRKKVKVVEELLKASFDPMTSIKQASTLMWKLECEKAKIESEMKNEFAVEGNAGVENAGVENAGVENVEAASDAANFTFNGKPVPPSEFEYLLGMPLWNLTTEQIDLLVQQLKQKSVELEALLGKTPEDLWELDLIGLENALDEQDQQDEECRAEHRAFKQKHRASMTGSKPRRRAAPKLKAKKKQQEDDHEMSAESFSSDDGREDDDFEPFKVSKAKAAPKKPQKETQKPKDGKISTLNSPRPLKGFSLADRIKSRNAQGASQAPTQAAKQTAAQEPVKQQTLEELLGIPSSSSYSEENSPNASERSKRSVASTDEDVLPRKRQRRLIVPRKIILDDDSDAVSSSSSFSNNENSRAAPKQKTDLRKGRKLVKKLVSDDDFVDESE